ncbi:universal stress protein [Thiohalorhabdus sp.]|uniref:universal stress protein n=1 Tax=Thiohalorhabdus sp. TaxID=3094134 RepID=UPI002FC2FBF2
MTDEARRDDTIRRLVVLVDASHPSRAALEEAAKLAARSGTELLGLFVEEEDILRSAALPFTQEIGPTSGTLRPMDPARIERRLRGQARDIQQLLRGLSERHAITASLEVARGGVVAQALAYITPEDLIVVGKTGGSVLRPGRLGSTARHLIGEASLRVMVLEEPGRQGERPTMVLFDQPEPGYRALATALRIARRDSLSLTLLLPPADPETVDDLRRRAETWLADQGAEADVQVLAGTSWERLAQAVHSREGRALVVSRSSPALTGDNGARLVEAVIPPVVFVP